MWGLILGLGGKLWGFIGGGFLSKVLPFLKPLGRYALPVIGVAAAYYVGTIHGELGAEVDFQKERLASKQAEAKALQQAQEKRHKAEMQDLADSIADRINTNQQSEVRREIIRKEISPDKDDYCRPSDRIVRLLERSRKGNYLPLPEASGAPSGERATPRSFSYADFVASYEELVKQFHLLRVRSNKLIQWNLDHAKSGDPATVRESLE